MKTVIAMLFVALMLAGCSSEPMPPMVHVKCDPGTNVSDKIDLSIFGELKPGIRSAEATAQFGQPKRSWTGGNGTVYQLYSFPQADVAVAKETSTSGGIAEDLPTLVSWTVFAFPPSGTNAFSLADLLSTDVQARLRRQAPPCQLVIHGSVGCEGVWCKVEAAGITEIRWLNNDSKK